MRVCEIFDKMCEAKPMAIGTVRTIPMTALPAANLTIMKTEGIKDMKQFFRHQLFMAGLCDDLWTKVMEAGKATLHESMCYAQEIEVIHHNRGGHSVNTVATTVTASDTPVTEEEEDNFMEEELKAINAICFRHGKPLFKPNLRRFNRNGNNGKSKTIVCHFCKR